MGSAIDPVVFWSVLALFALAALASVAMFWRLRRLRRSLAAVRQWVSVDATVSETRIVEIGAGDSSAYQPVVLFRYTVGGRDYLADGLEVGPRRSFLLKRNANRLLARYPVGSALRVWVDPADPAQAVADRRAPYATTLVVLFAVLWIVTLGGIAVLLFAPGIAGPGPALKF